MKIKSILIALVVIFVTGLLLKVRIQAGKIDRLETDNTRLDSNIRNLLYENIQITNLVLSQKEVTGKVKRERDSLAKELEVKPKQITKVVTITNTVHDTIKESIPVYITGQDTWQIADSGECWKWAANAFKQGDSLKVERTLFEYNNKTTQTFYKKAPHIWFIRIGKWRYLQRISSNCGEPKLQSIEFIK